MNLTFDIGNSAVKWAAFEGGEMVECGVWSAEGKLPQADAMLACVSGRVPVELEAVPQLRADMPLPIKIGYRSPDTLGPDRIAAACGAWKIHPQEASLIIDAGTCITVDFLDSDGVYHGGAIMPGLEMKLRALHTFTEKLPLVEIAEGRHAPVFGTTTEESIVAGTLGATMMALAGYVAVYREKCGRLRVLLTGGDAERLVAAGATGWEHCPQLTHIGMNGILTRNQRYGDK